MRGHIATVQFALQAWAGEDVWITINEGSYADLHRERRWLQRADEPLVLRILALL